MDVRAYGPTVTARFEDSYVFVTCRPGWEDATGWSAFCADIDALGIDGRLIFDDEHYRAHADGSETYVIPRQLTSAD